MKLLYMLHIVMMIECLPPHPLSNFTIDFDLFTETHEQLQAQFRQMQLEHYQLKEEYDDLKEKMKFFTKVWRLHWMLCEA